MNKKFLQYYIIVFILYRLLQYSNKTSITSLYHNFIFSYSSIIITIIWLTAINNILYLYYTTTLYYNIYYSYKLILRIFYFQHSIYKYHHYQYFNNIIKWYTLILIYFIFIFNFISYFYKTNMIKDDNYHMYRIK